MYLDTSYLNVLYVLVLSGIFGCLIGFLYAYSFIAPHKQGLYARIPLYGTLRIIFMGILFFYLLRLGVIPFILFGITCIVTFWIILARYSR